jgi:hypothetical protein
MYTCHTRAAPPVRRCQCRATAMSIRGGHTPNAPPARLREGLTLPYAARPRCASFPICAPASLLPSLRPHLPPQRQEITSNGAYAPRHTTTTNPLPPLPPPSSIQIEDCAPGRWKEGVCQRAAHKVDGRWRLPIPSPPPLPTLSVWIQGALLEGRSYVSERFAKQKRGGEKNERRRGQRGNEEGVASQAERGNRATPPALSRERGQGSREDDGSSPRIPSTTPCEAHDVKLEVDTLPMPQDQGSKRVRA